MTIEEDDRSESEDSADLLDPTVDEGWEDVEPDLEVTEFVCLFDNNNFPDLVSMLQHCKTAHHFDLVKVQQDLRLDFIETAKLVNYIRREVQEGRTSFDSLSKFAFQDDRYLQPTFVDDAVLYSLDDVIKEPSYSDGGILSSQQVQYSSYAPRDMDPLDKVDYYERQIQHRETQNEATQNSLQQSRKSCERLTELLEGRDKMIALTVEDDKKVTLKNAKVDLDKNDPYARRGIHQDMLEDKIRTNAYRSFIEANIDSFKGRTVLDVGCGTGILSMFCAKAGAKKVFAVEQSAVAIPASENVYRNGLQGVITVLHGSMEDVVISEQVDIIISEWMGYCLLYENMLPSVIYARDRYLKPGGLMIPAQTSLRIAPLSNPQYVYSRVGFWNDVYGYDMTAMSRGVCDEVDTTSTFLPEDIPADSCAFLTLDLYTIKVPDLSFTGIPFTVQLNRDVPALDGFVVWFDTYFLPPGSKPVPLQTKPSDVEEPASSKVRAMGTGPFEPRTHWNQGGLLIDTKGNEAVSLKKGTTVNGLVGYKTGTTPGVGLEVSVQWEAPGLILGAQTFNVLDTGS